MEPELQSSTSSRIIGGMARSAMNGMVMMGIYWSLMFAGSLLAPAIFPAIGLTTLAPALVVVGAVTIFGGVVASGILGHPNITFNKRNQAPATEMERELQQTQELEGPQQVPEIIPVPIPVMADKSSPDQAALEAAAPSEMAESSMEASLPQKRWADRPDISAGQNRDRIAQILADGASDRSHADAILSAQREDAASPTLH